MHWMGGDAVHEILLVSLVRGVVGESVHVGGVVCWGPTLCWISQLLDGSSCLGGVQDLWLSVMHRFVPRFCWIFRASQVKPQRGQHGTCLLMAA